MNTLLRIYRLLGMPASEDNRYEYAIILLN